MGALLGANALTATAATVVLSSAHFVRLFRREISGVQFPKDVTTTGASVVGGIAGWQVGARLGERFGPVGALVGGVAAALVVANLSAAAAKTLLDTFVQDDTENMIRVAETVFQRLAFDYLLTDDEAAHVAREFVSSDLSAVLRRMYAAPDRVAFAEARAC